MAEIADDDVTRLTDLMRPEFGICGAATLARRLLEQGVTLPPPPPDPAVDIPQELTSDLVGWAIAIISNVDHFSAGWPQQTEEWRDAARNWLDAAHPSLPDPAVVVAVQYVYEDDYCCEEHNASDGCPVCSGGDRTDRTQVRFSDLLSGPGDRHGIQQRVDAFGILAAHVTQLEEALAAAAAKVQEADRGEG